MDLAQYSPTEFFLVFFIAAVGFALGPVILSRVWALLFSPPKPGQDKQATYECGLQSSGDAWVRFHPGHYLYAILFLVFDVEAVFLMPLAVAYTSLTLGAVFCMLVFLLLLAEGLVWSWKKGFLEWR